METEFIVLTISLIVSSLLAVYFGIKFVICFESIKKNLRMVKPYIPDNECEITHKQGYQKTDGYARGEGMQVSPFCISTDNPNSNAYKYGGKHTIANQFKNGFFSHAKRIISGYQLNANKTHFMTA